MNREQMVINILAMHRRMNPPGGKCLCGHETPLGRLTTEHVARAVLDAILPQVTTVAELEALSMGSRLVDANGDVYRPSGSGLILSESGTLIRIERALTPLTVVWQPEVSK